jgi:hypothetical protein
MLRDVSNVEDSAGVHTLAYVVLAGTEFERDGTSFTVNKTDGSTTFHTRTLTVSATALGIVGAGS